MCSGSTVAGSLNYGSDIETESWNIQIKDVSSIIFFSYYIIQTVGVTYDMSETLLVISIAEPITGSEVQFETFSN